MTRRTRVLHVIQNLNYGGMERVLADIVRRIDRNRFEPHVLALQYLGRFAAGLESCAELHVAEPLRRLSIFWPGPLVRQFRQIAPQVVHLHSGVWYKGSLAARASGARRVIYTEHGRPIPDPLPARLIDAVAARRTDVVVAVSEALARQLAEKVVGDARRITVVPNGIDTETFRPRPDCGTLRRALGVSPNAPIIGSIGRLEHIKGYDVMVEAFAALRRRWEGTPAPVMVVGGEGSERPRLEALAARHGVAGDVHLLGWRDDVHDLHASFTLFSLASRSEGTSISLLEAMSAGNCPVVTDVGGNAAVLGDALRHLLVPSESPDALAAAWQDALSDGDRLRADGAAARRRVEERFGVDAMVRRYEALYEPEAG